MRIFSVTIVRNEAQRYLESFLRHHRPHLDGMLVYDDHSSDNSVAIAMREGCAVCQRPQDVPGFMEHEGAMRDDALAAAADAFYLDEGDWIVSLDADEFLMANHEDLRTQLEKDITAAEESKIEALFLYRPELWQLHPPLVRFDGFWAGSCTRVWRWRSRSQARVRDRPMGCGSEPTYIRESGSLPTSMVLLHLGYATAEDRSEKFERYTGKGAASGHNPLHISSILGAANVRPWTGPMPDLWRGQEW